MANGTAGTNVSTFRSIYAEESSSSMKAHWLLVHKSPPCYARSYVRLVCTRYECGSCVSNMASSRYSNAEIKNTR